jgi:predicted nuclease of predicted toxin-antitoxin system
VKLLLDQNLSRKLPAKLQDIFLGTSHVIAERLDAATDTQIWTYAKANDFCIVTKDVDFAERSKLLGAPPKVVWLRCGNTTPGEVENIIRTNAVLILELDANPTWSFIEIR